MASPKPMPSAQAGYKPPKPASSRDVNGNLKQKGHPNPVSSARSTATARSIAPALKMAAKQGTNSGRSGVRGAR